LLALGGIAPTTHHKVTVERVETEAEKVKNILDLAEKLGWSEEQKRNLLGAAMPQPVIDVTVLDGEKRLESPWKDPLVKIADQA
jgi:hypothetical protein